MNPSAPTILRPTAETFDAEVLQSEAPVLIDFWAPWCPPCRLQEPEIGRAAEALAGRAKVAMINVDEEPELAAMLGVRSIPALLVFAGGAVADMWAGLTPWRALVERVEPWMGPGG